MSYKVKSGGVRGFLRRNASSISLVIIALSIVAVLLMQAFTIAQLQKEVAHQTNVIDSVKALAEQIDRNAQDRSRQIDDINKHLDCIVQFFSQPDRSQRSIDNIESCRITTNSAFYTQTPPSQQSTSQPTSQPVNQPPQPAPTSPQPAPTPPQPTPASPQPAPPSRPLSIDSLLNQLHLNF